MRCLSIWLFTVLVLMLLPKSDFAQGELNIENTSRDSVYLIQFIALKDCDRTFDEISNIGEVIKEYFPGRDICRYSLGYFGSISFAEQALSEVREVGFGDAFIRKTVPEILSPIEVIGAQPPLVREEEMPSPEPEVIGTSERPADEISKSTSISSTQTYESMDDGSVEVDDESNEVKKISLLYTGKSLGVLGNTRFQKEHELVTEYAIEKDVKFKLVSHACWRTKGLTIFLPSDEPEGGEFQEIINSRQSWEVLESYPALRTNNVLMFRDPDRVDFDMLNVVLQNERTYRAFPEIEKVNIRIYRTVIDEDKECLIIEEEI